MTKRRRISVVISSIFAAGAGVLAASVVAGPDNIKFPDDFDKGVMYAIVDRYDIKQYRELWSTPAGVKALADMRRTKIPWRARVSRFSKKPRRSLAEPARRWTWAMTNITM